MDTRNIEKRVDGFTSKIAADKLKAFEDLLLSYKHQAEAVAKAHDSLYKFKQLLESHAKQANYKIDWGFYSVKEITKP